MSVNADDCKIVGLKKSTESSGATFSDVTFSDVTFSDVTFSDVKGELVSSSSSTKSGVLARTQSVQNFKLAVAFGLLLPRTNALVWFGRQWSSRSIFPWPGSVVSAVVIVVRIWLTAAFVFAFEFRDLDSHLINDDSR